MKFNQKDLDVPNSVVPQFFQRYGSLAPPSRYPHPDHGFLYIVPLYCCDSCCFSGPLHHQPLLSQLSWIVSQHPCYCLFEPAQLLSLDSSSPESLFSWTDSECGLSLMTVRYPKNQCHFDLNLFLTMFSLPREFSFTILGLIRQYQDLYTALFNRVPAGLCTHKTCLSHFAGCERLRFFKNCFKQTVRYNLVQVF